MNLSNGWPMMGSTGEIILFACTAIVMVGCALGVLFFKKAAHSVICMVGVMLGLAVLYIANNAPFLGVAQIVVYTGAIMMLFLFVIMLIGIGTLLSGSIGVSNIMMVVVKERTTEIGVRRAIGARPAQILMQILTESAVLTLLAGLTGIVVAVLILVAAESGIGGNFPSLPSGSFLISFSMALGSAFSLSALGVLAGVAPALRALAIKPIDAIRDE